MNHQEIAALTRWAQDNNTEGIVVLPSGDVSITDTATKLFGLIAPTKTMFVRGGAVLVLMQQDGGFSALEVLRPAAARSAFEKYATFLAWRAGKDGSLVLKPTVCPEEMAKALLESQEAASLLPRVQGLINCPVIREVKGELVVAASGYDEVTGVLVTGGSEPMTVALTQARGALSDLLADFDFQSEGDKARAMASMITPALKMGGLLSCPVPAEIAEADQSQAGKGYRQKVFAAVYNERLSLVTNRAGGVGSIDESLNQRLVEGRPFIQFDNFRGKFDSSHLEALLTADKAFPCRVPHRGEIMVQPDKYFVFFTSNGVDTTRDFANRSNIVRIRKRSDDYAFKKYPEGDLLNHVRANQPYYLGCIFAVVREWHAKGKPRSSETRHDFREWVQVVDWILQNIFGMVPLMDGHRNAQERVSDPQLVWVRTLVLAMKAAGKLDDPLTATQLYELCKSAHIDIPGVQPGCAEQQASRIIGGIMTKVFEERQSLELEALLLKLDHSSVARKDPAKGGRFPAKTYTLSKR